MKFEDKYIDELVDLRNEARAKKNWKLSDEIRDYLDTKQTFIFDTIDGQVVYHGKENTRQKLIEQLKKETRAEKMFDAWLFSVKESISTHLSTS
jgi:hypothetical protein